MSVTSLGLDSSGQQNSFTVANLYYNDSSLDSPTNNFCTLNPLDIGSYGTLSQGMLKNYNQGYSTIKERRLVGTMAYSTSDTQGYYWEIYYKDNEREDLQTIGVQHIATIDGQGNNATNNILNGEGQYGLTWNQSEAAMIYYPWAPNDDLAGAVTGGGSDNSGALVGIAVKGSNIWLRINGAWVAGTSGTGNPATGAYPTYTAVPDGIYTPFGGPWQGYGGASGDTSNWRWNFGQNGTFDGYKTAQGNTDGNGYGDFYYSVPAGFFALCSKNLPAPTIKKPGGHFSVVRWVGSGSTDQDISGVGFQPDMAWIKNRAATNGWPNIQDSVRGAGESLFTNATDAEYDYSDYFGPFQSDGYRLADVTSGHSWNTGSTNYVSWNWKAGGSGSSNTDGSINTISTSANTTAKFSISKYTGTGSNATIGHGLGVAPDFIIVKSTSSAQSWLTYHSKSGVSGGSDPHTDYLFLNSTAASTDDNSAWNDTAPTSTVFSIGTSWASNKSGETYVAYCWADVEGYSRFGHYEGNNSTNGPFVYTGFTPSWIMIKYADGVDESWWIQSWETNSYNKSNWATFANLNSAEGEYGVIDFLSNGFKIRSTNGGLNGNTSTYVFVAFADYPFKYANAR